MTDAELVRASQGGDRTAYGRLIERHQSAVCAVSYAATGDRALSEDVAQDTFIAAWGQLDRLREPRKLRPWLCGIARNLGRKALRRRGRELPAERSDEVAAEIASPFDATSEAESERIVRTALARLPATYREALVLYYRENRSAREVAAALDISENAALQRLSRGRKMLADGVTELVERSLSEGPRRPLAGAVLAALPPVTTPPARVEPTQTTHGGWSMIKIAALAGLVAVAGGTTAYLVNDTGGQREAAAAPAATSDPASAARTPVARPEPPALPGRVGAVERRAPALPPGAAMAPEPDQEPTISAADIARLGLYDGPARGPADAPVKVVVFTDFMCNFCGKVLGTLDELWDDYPNQLRLVIKQMPVHEEAVLAAEAALAAADQGKFWELHDLMMANQHDLTRDAILGYARRAGLDVAALAADLDSGRFAGGVAADKATAADLDIRGTPSFVINGRRFVGARPIDQFRDMIDAALADRR